MSKGHNHVAIPPARTVNSTNKAWNDGIFSVYRLRKLCALGRQTRYVSTLDVFAVVCTVYPLNVFSH